MAKKIKPPDQLPSKAWLMSFGDTMTTLLAFFIVLCSLAEDQSGANLHSGTGSFIRTLKAGGLPGAFSGDKSSRSVHLEATSPLYSAQSEADANLERGGIGPDDDSNDIQSLDREQEEFMRLLNEMERMADLKAQPNTTGETTFDFFEKLAKTPPFLPANFGEIAIRIVPLLRKGKHRVELVVWAATPSRTARTRASLQASEIVAEVTRQSGLPKSSRKRMLGLGRTWPYKDAKRPVLSLVIRRVTDST